jgi:hypothetical protein
MHFSPIKPVLYNRYMDVPAEIASNAPAIIEHGAHWVAAHIEGEIGDFAWKQVVRSLARVFPALAEADPRELAKRMTRVEETLYATQDELTLLKARHPQQDIEMEMLEPAAQDFVSDAFAAVMESPNPEKRRLLGRLIAQRLYAQTESEEELYLRQAESITRRANQAQLWALATLYLVHYPLLPPGLSRDQIYRWMDDHLLPILEVVAKDDPSYETLDYLTSLGAVRYDGSDQSDNLVIGTHAPSIEQRVLQATNEHFEPFSSKPVGHFYKNAYDLYEGKFSKDAGQERISLAPYTLTVPGFKVAQAVVEQLVREHEAKAILSSDASALKRITTDV